MISAIFQIISKLLPFVLKLFAPEAQRRRENAEFDKALAENNPDDITRLLSERYDRVRRKKKRNNS
jgi:hypothetical protein